MNKSEQKKQFLLSEADSWFDRNKNKLKQIESNPSTDLVLSVLSQLDIKPRSVLEIGACNGWRLNAINEIYSSKVTGIEPSTAAIEDGEKNFPNINLIQGTADELPFETDEFDLVIFGFCLYLCDPTDLFKIADNVDRVLKDNSWLIIMDFIPPRPYRNSYEHLDGLYSYKMDYSQLFMGHPAYQLMSRIIQPDNKTLEPDNIVGVNALYKKLKIAFPDNPYT